jgi:hypothetical protein
MPLQRSHYAYPRKHRRPARYYGANATRQYKGSLLDFGDAQSRNRIKASPLYPNPASRRTGREDARQQARCPQNPLLQVEAVLQMLQPGFNAAAIAAKRRVKSNPWFKRGTLYRSALDVLRRATAPMTSREIADALIADKAPQATRKRAIDLQAAVLAALRKRNGGTVVGDGAPTRWKLASPG